MAKMLPAEIFGACPSLGEREVFARLRESTNTRDWIVLHSLDIAQHVRQVSGEADFVVIIPSQGVLCIEVKACRRLGRNDAGWFYGGEEIADARGPFRQAAEAMHSIRNRLIRKRPDLSHVLFWSAVIFPYVDFKETSGEWHSWQVIDATLFRQRPISVNLENVLKNARTFLSTCGSAKRIGSSPFTAKEAESIAKELRPNFELFESPGARTKRWEDEVRRYTEEQFVALDALQQNQRVLFTGPAGTGKTLLAIEAVRRAHAAGQRCLFLCFNRLLGQWLQEQTAPLGPLVLTSTYHSFLISLTGINPKNENTSEHFWKVELPERAIEVLLDRDPPNEPFDALIIDEAQDLLSPIYLDTFDLLLRGGMAAGRWRFFGDLEKQAIYSSGASDPIAQLRQRSGEVPVFSLRVNCRNSPRIAALVRLLGGLSPDYTRVLRPDNGIEPELKFFKTPKDQEELLQNVLETWYAEGIRGAEMIVLSPRADHACLAAQISKEPWRSRLRPRDAVKGGQIPYCSIHAFKGLEASAVVITDVERLSGGFPIDLFYIAVTRALHRLTIFAHESARESVIRALTGASARAV